MIDVSKVSDEERAAILARRAYFAEWRARNREKVRKNNLRYWGKRSKEDLTTNSGGGKNGRIE